MPDAQVWEDLWLCHLKLGTLLSFQIGEGVFVRKHQQEIAEIVWCSTKPVLEAKDETARILSLLDWQVFENVWQRVEQLQH
ncbi:MAG: Uncharacterised protein [Prochlorococcus marinus str. MIT 9215]|nr:MAG: Uncharacterised protein [Prochlorococcus marinus str. MIT 9215]